MEKKCGYLMWAKEQCRQHWCYIEMTQNSSLDTKAKEQQKTLIAGNIPNFIWKN